MAATHALPRSPQPRNPLQGGSPASAEPQPLDGGHHLHLSTGPPPPSLGDGGEESAQLGMGQGRCLAGAGMEVPAPACTDWRERATDQRKLSGQRPASPS